MPGNIWLSLTSETVINMVIYKISGAIMNELNAEQLDLVSGGEGLTSNGGGQWQVYTGPLPLPSGGSLRPRQPLMQSDGSNGEDPVPVGWGW
jgi:hypothetical protein